MASGSSSSTGSLNFPDPSIAPWRRRSSRACRRALSSGASWCGGDHEIGSLEKLPARRGAHRHATVWMCRVIAAAIVRLLPSLTAIHLHHLDVGVLREASDLRHMANRLELSRQQVAESLGRGVERKSAIHEHSPVVAKGVPEGSVVAGASRAVIQNLENG